MLCRQVATYKMSCFASSFLPALLRNFTMEEVNSMMLLRVSFIGSSKFISLIWSSLDIKERNLPFLMSNLYLYGNLDLLLPIPLAPSWSRHQNLDGPSPVVLKMYSGFLGLVYFSSCCGGYNLGKDGYRANRK